MQPDADVTDVRRHLPHEDTSLQSPRLQSIIELSSISNRTVPDVIYRYLCVGLTMPFILL